MGYKVIDLSLGWEEINRRVSKLYGSSLLFLSFSLEIIAAVFAHRPARNRQKFIMGIRAIREEFIRKNRLYRGNPKFNEDTFRVDFPKLHSAIEDLLESHDYKYYLQKLKDRDLKQYAIKKGEFEKLKSQPFIPSEKGGRPPKIEYVVGATWSRFIRGRDKKVHWKNIHVLMGFLTREYINKPIYDYVSFDLDSIPENNLKVHCGRLAKRYGKEIDDFLELLDRMLDLVVLLYGSDI
jgi:hypothetical protein